MSDTAIATLDKIQVGTLQALSQIFDRAAMALRASSDGLKNIDLGFQEQLDRGQLCGATKAHLSEYTEHLPNLKKAISVGLRQAFNRVGQSQSRKIGDAAKITLQLVSKDDVELQIILAHFEKQLIDSYQEPLAMLSMRFDRVCRRDLAIEQLPVSPVSLGQILTDSIKALMLDVESKKVLLLALLIALQAIYMELLTRINQLFIQYKVLVDLSPRHLEVKRKRELQRRQAAVKRKKLLGLEDSDADLHPTEQIQQFFNKLNIPSANKHLVQGAVGEPAISQKRLLAELDKIAHLGLETGGYKTIKQNKSLAKQLSEAVSAAHYSLSKTMAKTISLISMVFEDLFNNANIPDEIKALLAELQSPLLKAALQDDRFLADVNNPAQTLLNNIAEAGLGWSPEGSAENDVLYQKIVKIVETVKQNFEDDYLIFDDAISDLFTFREGAEQQTEQIETRIIDRETAQARLQKAREVAKTHIDKTFSRLRLPAEINEFVQGTWQQVLFFIYNKDPNEASPAWQDAVEIERSLLTNLKEKQTDDVEVFLIVLEEKLLDSGISQVQVNQHIEKITKVLTGDYEPVVELEAAVEEEIQTSEHDAEDETLLAEVVVGSWFLKCDQEPALKIKVAAHIKFNNSYVMVKRNGIKDSTYTREQLAEQLRSGKMRLLQNQLAFDSALENVISNIR